MRPLVASRHLAADYHGHRHTLHLVIVEDCDADERGHPCDAMDEGEDKSTVDRMFDMITKFLGFTPEMKQ